MRLMQPADRCTRRPRGKERGFTLIEIMIVVLIIAVLSGIAMASYGSAMVKARRGQAQSCLLEQSQFLERFYTVNMAYDKTIAGAKFVPLDCEGTVLTFYKIEYDPAVTSDTYTIKAIPNARQKDTMCGTLEITHTGARKPATKGCW